MNFLKTLSEWVLIAPVRFIVDELGHTESGEDYKKLSPCEFTLLWTLIVSCGTICVSLAFLLVCLVAYVLCNCFVYLCILGLVIWGVYFCSNKLLNVEKTNEEKEDTTHENT